MLVKNRMTHHPITVRPKASLHDALRIMRESKVRRLPVLDDKGKLVGIVSGEAVAVCLSLAGHEPEHP